MRALLSLLFALVITTSSQAGEIKFVKNKTWKEILLMAKQQNKMIFFDAYATWCGPCKYMEESIYTNDEVATYYNTNFINVKMDMEDGEGIRLSKEFDIAAYPTLLFFNPAGKPVHKAVGVLEADDFIDFAKDAAKPETQYYTMKAKVSTLTDAQFAKWAKMAKRNYDDDLNRLAQEFFARKKDILLNEYTAIVAIKYVDSLTDAQLNYLASNQAKIATLMETSDRGAWRMLYDKFFKMASKVYNADADKEGFRSVFHQYFPASERFAMSDLDIRIAMYIDEDTKAGSELLTKFLKNGSLTLQEAGEIFYDMSEELKEEDMKGILKSLETYKPSTADKANEGYLYFIQAVCYVGIDEKDKGKPIAQKAMENVATPEDYKLMLQILYDL